MRVLTAACLTLGFAALAHGQNILVEPPTYTAGALITTGGGVPGQDGWRCCKAGSAFTFFTVDTTTFSPMGGSTMSIKASGPGGSRVYRPLPAPISTGIYRVSYDFMHTGRAPGSTNNLRMNQLWYDSGTNQLFQIDMFNDGPAQPGLADQSIFADPDGLGGTGYGAVYNLFDSNPVIQPNVWYRVKFVVDFDQHILVDFKTYDISSGSEVLVASNPGTYYINNNGTTFFTWADFSLRMDAASASEAYWFDNFTLTATTLPPPDIKALATPTKAKATVPYQQQLGLYAPQPVTWSLVTDSPATINPTTGLISGWTPSAGQVGTTFNFSATATNAQGADNVAWQVVVVSQYEQLVIPFDNQINIGAGATIVQDAGHTIEFRDPELPQDTDRFMRYKFLTGAGANGYWHVNIYPQRAGYSAMDISSCATKMTALFRWFRNSGTYNDSPVIMNMYSGNGGKRDFGFIYPSRTSNTPQVGEFHPDWKTITVWLSNPGIEGYTDSGSFNPADVTRIELWGTDWGGAGLDFCDFNNLTITNEPLVPDVTPVTPNLVTAFVGSPYTFQPSLVQCTPVTWSKTAGPGSIDANTGLLSGWTPAVGELGNVVNFSVTATNALGSDTENWQVIVKPIPVADSGIAQPWGTVHANIGGTQSSNAASLIMSDEWANGAAVDWTFDAISAGLNRPFDRVSSITFDEAGNLYWKTADANGYVASVTPTGTLRWIGNVNGTNAAIGSGDKSSVVVGDQGNDGRVYVLTDTGAAAFAKSNGDRIWNTDLPGTNFAGTGEVLTPVLYGGKLYVLGAGTPTKKLYQLNSTTGAVEWSSDVAGCTATQGGQMALVPDAAGAGKHYLYYNATSGSGNDAAAEMFAILVDTTTSSASLAWSASGGHVSRSHVIDVAAVGRVCTHTWRDHGSSLHCWNYDGTQPSYTTDQARDGHGYEDFGAVDFNGIDVIAGGFEGRLARYSGIATPGVQANPANVAYDAGGFEAFAIGALAGQNGWDGYSTAPEIVADPTGGGYGNVLKLQGTSGALSGAVRAVAGLTGPVITMEWDQYRTDLTDTQWLADRADYGNTWWAYRAGGASSVLTACYWTSAGATLSAGVWQHVKYTFNLVEQSVSVEVDGGAKGYAGLGDALLEGIDFELEGNGGAVPMYIDNIVVRQGALTAPTAFVTSWYKMDPDFGENRGGGGLYQNESGDSIYLAGTSSQQIVALNVSANTPYTVDANANPAEHPRLFAVDSGSTAHPTGGPLLGPTVGGKQRIYYFSGGSSGTLTALTPVRYAAADFDKDGYVDRDDFVLFLPCALGAEVPQTDPNCALMDIDGDGDVDADDFGAYQQCFSGAVLADVDCYP